MRRETIGILLSTILILIYLFFTFPVLASVLSCIVIAFILYTAKSNSSKNEQAYARRAALHNVEIYMSPHKNIWRNLKVSNKFCTLILDSSGNICVKEKIGACRSFIIANSAEYSNDQIFNMLCMSFDHLTSYEKLQNGCRIYNVHLIESQTDKCDETVQSNKTAKAVPNRTDINNASEVELTALPGISIVVSKKIIKKREENNGFKNIDEFFDFIKLKPHMENQLREMVYVTKMQGSIRLKRNTERSVDI